MKMREVFSMHQCPRAPPLRPTRKEMGSGARGWVGELLNCRMPDMLVLLVI